MIRTVIGIFNRDPTKTIIRMILLHVARDFNQHAVRTNL